jgi:hypothetical protein
LAGRADRFRSPSKAKTTTTVSDAARRQAMSVCRRKPVGGIHVYLKGLVRAFAPASAGAKIFVDVPAANANVGTPFVIGRIDHLSSLKNLPSRTAKSHNPMRPSR